MVLAALALLGRAQNAIRSGANDTASSDPTPTCQPPPMPAPTYPHDPSKPGQGYGVPFLAEITGAPITGPLGSFPMTGGKLLGGYDEQWGNGGYSERWKAATWNITGWASGLLEIPSLQSVVTPDDIVFCQQSNDPSSPIYTALPNGIDYPTGTFLTNSPDLVAKEGGAVLQLVVSIHATAASLRVAGVEPNGSLDLAGSTTATDTITDDVGVHETCQEVAPLTINLSTQESPPPVGAPPGVGYVIPPVPLSGPIGQAAATVSGDDLSIPRFEWSTQCGLAIAFNFALGGYNAQGVANWPCTTDPNCQEIASEPGWSQFGADVKLYKLDLPVGPPVGFGL
jgi:hypothetical protein